MLFLFRYQIRFGGNIHLVTNNLFNGAYHKWNGVYAEANDDTDHDILYANDSWSVSTSRSLMLINFNNKCRKTVHINVMYLIIKTALHSGQLCDWLIMLVNVSLPACIPSCLGHSGTMYKRTLRNPGNIMGMQKIFEYPIIRSWNIAKTKMKKCTIFQSILYHPLDEVCQKGHHDTNNDIFDAW